MNFNFTNQIVHFFSSRFFICVALLLVGAKQVDAQTTVTVVDGNLTGVDNAIIYSTFNTCSSPAPAGSDCRYSLYQHIFDKSLIGQGGQINSFQFETGAAAPNYTYRNVNIYFGETDKTSFTSNVDWVNSGLTLVYSGNLNATAGFYTVTPTNSFFYSGTKNLVIVVYQNAGNNPSSISYRHLHANAGAGSNVTMYSLSNNATPIPVYGSWSGVPTGTRASVLPGFKIVFPSCTTPTSAGTLSPGSGGCAGYNPPVISSVSAPGGYSGLLMYKWQQSTDDGTTWTDIASSNTETYDPPALSQTTLYKRLARVTCNASWAETSPVIITISCDNPSNPGDISLPSNYTTGGMCVASYTPTAISNQIAAAGTCNVEYKWQFSTDNGANWTDIASSNSTSFTPSSAITQTTWYKRLARATCKTDWIGAAETSPIKIIVSTRPVDGGVIGSSQGVCGASFDPATINSISDASPCASNVEYKWQVRPNSQTIWQDIPSSNSPTYNPPVITETTRYRRVARLFGAPDWNNAVFSNSVTMTLTSSIGISRQPVNDTIYQQLGVALFQAIPNITTVGAVTYQWQLFSNGSWTSITNGGYYLGVNDSTLYITNPVYAMNGNLYRCILTTATCGAVTSNAATLFVLPTLTGTNSTTISCNSWTSSSVEVTIPVSNVGSLNSTTNMLRQINIAFGNQGACKKDMSTYSFTLIAPNGVSYKFIKGLTTSTFPLWGDIKFRDHSALEKISEYTTTVQSSYFPYSIGYYGVENDDIFMPTFNGINANGTWKIRIEKNNGTAGGISLEKAELIFGSKITAIDVTGNSINNACALATCMGADASVIIGTNNGYSDPDPNYPGGNFNGCNWNADNNNSAWYYFFASSTSAYITISGLKAISLSGSSDMQMVVMNGSSGCLPLNSALWTVPTGGCSDDETINNSIYRSSNGGGTVTAGNVYSNGITANTEFNLTGLTPGQRYLLMIDGFGGTPSSYYIEIPTGGQNCILGGLLPFRFSTFNASLSNSQTDLFWQTSNEENNQYFQIERSADGINWKSLQTIEGAGVRSTSIRKYTSADKEPLYGFNYYRIRQVNTDGTFSYSEVRKVNNRLTTNISVFPNPAADFAIVEGLDKNRFNIIHLLDVTGKLISEHFIKDSQYRFNLSKLQPGIYHVVVNGTEHFQLTKQ